MKKHVKWFLWLLFISGTLSSCYLPVPPQAGQVNEDIAQQYSTVSALLTETAWVGSGSTPVPISQPSATTTARVMSEVKTTPTALLTTPPDAQVDGPGTGQAPGIPCDLAQAGLPIDISVPDDTLFHPGESFSKTWRLHNSGACVWTRDYAVVWFSGDDLGVSHSQLFNFNVSPGSSVDVTVEMMAPENPGIYQSNWKIRNAEGDMFGIGPNGGAPFWTRIVVVPLDTPTVVPTQPAPTPTPIIFASGSILLSQGEGADLDSGQINQSENDDLLVGEVPADPFSLAPGNGARMNLFGTLAPAFEDCLHTSLSNEPVDLADNQVGSFFCFRTTEGLPGRILLKAINSDAGNIDFDFVTWAVP
jgi:hypothetical protein